MKFALISASLKHALELAGYLRSQINFVPPEESDVIIVLGGDGELLHAMHNYMHLGVPFYGVNFGSVGFLMNAQFQTQTQAQSICQKILNSRSVKLNLLEMQAQCMNGNIHKSLAINEVSIFRNKSQALKMQILVDQVVRLPELVSDGALVSTPAGSSAYNFSAGGPIVPLESNILCLTTISPFRPRRWHGALLKASCTVTFHLLEPEKRSANVVADFHEFQNVSSVSIRSVNDRHITILCDETNAFEDRVMKEQFSMSHQ